ncbi:ubiquinone biosynthesis protein COQ4 homolog, mitochondrial [Aplysia californica]|uniref:Ubiquinone biosynthesis protein COQ4 homolog, mitochondrial n=1 Tax=Aplysia californica TaxID=6500 RepID=A0ABM0K322_APLCA|nr:ubiquinone biosynthesis protein COQ4 homolog, mitochondrial [Aplysia californica]
MSAAVRHFTYCRLSRWRKWHSQSLKVPSRSLSSGDHAELDEAHHTEDQETSENQPYDVLYPGHISTSFFQKSLLAFGSGIACLLNPARDDMICALGETTGPPALKYMQRKMLADPVGRQILEDKPLISTDTIDVPYLGSLPEGTFGKEYWHFLDKNGFSPDARRPVNFVDDTELMYVMLRYRQCHDLMHTLLGMPPNMLGEVAVKWFEAIQTGLPMCVTAALFGPVRLGPKHRQKYTNTYLPWAIRSAYNSKFLMNVYFERHWEQDLDELRKELNVEPAPIPLIKTGKNTVTK